MAKRQTKRAVRRKRPSGGAQLPLFRFKWIFLALAVILGLLVLREFLVPRDYSASTRSLAVKLVSRLSHQKGWSLLSSTWIERREGRDRWEMAVTTWRVEGSPRQGLKNLQRAFPGLRLRGGGREWICYRGDWEVLRVLVVAGARPPVVLEEEEKARVAIVIDDMGYRLDRAQAFLDLPWSITFSILPFTDQAQEIAYLAHRRGREVVLHLPMDANGGGEAIERLESRTPGMLLVSMSDGELRNLIRREMEQVPFAKGANNHMGSRFTRSARCMRVVLRELKARGYYFLDSLTDSRSVACRVAKKVGVKCFQRDVFLDNSKDEAYILHQLTLLARLALRKGYAVAIGHPSQATLEALRRGLPKLEKMGIKVVPLSEL